MAKRTTAAAQVIDDALTAEPTVASTTLARRLYADHPELWPSFNACYCAVRRLRGALGKLQRAKMSHSTMAERSTEESEACQRWGALIPDPAEKEVVWHKLPEGDGEPTRWLIVSDMHIPYHSKLALELCLAHAEGNCDGVLILGDLIDCYHLSRFERDPRKRHQKAELDATKQFLDAIQEGLQPRRIVLKEGNHEARLERYLIAKAPELLEVGGVDWDTWLELPKRGIVRIPEQCPIEHHQLSLIHGHEWGNRFSSPVNPARGAFLKAHDCLVEAHGHRPSLHTEDTLRGRPITCWSLGCLCDLNPRYRPLGNKWRHGFAYLDAGSQWRVWNHSIVEGEVT